MRRLLVMTILLVAAAVPAATPPLPAPVKCLEHSPLRPKSDDEWPPPPQDDRGFDVLSYDLDLRLDPATRTVTGANAVRLRILADGQSTLLLDLVDELDCTGVEGPDGPLVFDHAGDGIAIQVPAPLAGGQTYSLTIRWTGVPPPHGPFRTGLMFRVHEAGTPGMPEDDVPAVANMSEPWSAHAWWPCKDTPGDKALVSVAMTVPDTLVAVSNGRLLGREEPEPGWSTFRYASGHPVAPYLVSVAASDYAGWGELCSFAGHGPVVAEYRTFPQHEQAGRFDLGRTCRIMEFLVGLAGPYPFADEGYRQVEFKWFGSMEHQTATSLSQIVFTGDRRYEGVVVHEMAHQWFGDSLTPRTWADIWLNEGFARYVEALWIEQDQGPEAYREFMRLIGPTWHPNLFQGEGTLGDPHPILPNSLIYDKGAWVLHMLRMRIGDAAFFAFLGDYASDPDLAYGNVELADMIDHAERAAGEDLGAFFDPWVWTETVPVVEIATTVESAGRARVALTQLQSPPFDLTVPVRLYTGCDSTDVTVRLAARSAEESWALDCPVDSVKVDPDGMVLMRTGDRRAPSLEVRGPVPNPAARGRADFDLYLMSDTEVTVKIYDIRGAKIATRPLGRLAATGPAGSDDASPRVWTWLAGESGRRPAAGVYWLEFTAADGGRAVRKVTLLD